MGVTALGLSDGIGEGGPRLEGLWTPGGQALSVEGRGLHGNGSQCSQIEREVKGIPGRGHRLSKGRRHELAAVVWVAAISASSPHSPAYGRVLPALAQRLAFPSIPRGLWILRFPVRGRHMNCGSQELQGREVQRERESVGEVYRQTRGPLGCGSISLGPRRAGRSLGSGRGPRVTS